MNATQLVTKIREGGGDIQAVDGSLKLAGSRSLFTPETVEHIRQHKPELLALLSPPVQLPVTSALTLEHVQCCTCQHFQRDTIGSGQGLGQCAEGQGQHQRQALWPAAQRLCEAHKPINNH